MIKSMTGYGKAVLNLENREYQVEIKSVNHRYTDINEKIKRGKIDVFITFENNIKKEKM